MSVYPCWSATRTHSLEATSVYPCWSATRTHTQHMLFILYVTNITDRRSTFGPKILFNSKSVYPQPESGSAAKNVMGKIQ
eukprot:652579-Pelagomonas_calceolata.AAC.1